MKINVRVIGRVLVVELFGELDLNTAPRFRDVVEDELHSNPAINHILLLMRGVTFIDSSGLGVILGRSKKAQAPRWERHNSSSLTASTKSP